MAGVTASFLLSGKALISGSLAGFSAVSLHSFAIGDIAGFNPLSSDTVPRGNTVFTGYSGLVSSKMTEQDTVRHTLVIPESVGPFNMGNVIVYGSHIDGVAVPFISVAFPFGVEKIRADPNLEDSLETPTPGSRFVIHIDIKHSIFGEALEVTVVAPDYASLPFFATEASVPPANLNAFSQFVVNHDSRVGSPVLVSKKEDGSYWGVPMHQNFRNPKFGIIDGGNAGDAYQPSQDGILSGFFYDTPDEEYAGVIGGMPYSQSYDGNNDQVIGGLPYTGA